MTGWARLSAFAFAALLGASSARAEIRVGVAGPESGRNQFTGEQQLVGAQKAVDAINVAGGLLGQKVVTIPVDDACDERQAEAAARQLVAARVAVVIGHVCSSASMAAQRLYDAAGILMLTPGSTNPKVTDEGSPNTFRVIGRDDQQGAVVASYLADVQGRKRIAIVHDGSVYGLGLATETQRHLNRRGVKEVLVEAYQPGQSDYATLVAGLAERGVDALFVGGYSSDIAIITRQAKRRLPGLQVVSGDTLATPDFLITAGEAADGVLFTFGPDIRRRPEAAAIVASFLADGYDPAGKTLYSYAAVQVWAQAVQQAGTLAAPDVSAALHRATFDTVLGPIGFDHKGDLTGPTPFILYRMGKTNFAPLE